MSKFWKTTAKLFHQSNLKGLLGLAGGISSSIYCYASVTASPETIGEFAKPMDSDIGTKAFWTKKNNSDSGSSTFLKKDTNTQLPNKNTIDDYQKQQRWRQLKVFSGTANPKLAEAVANILGTGLGKIDITKFADGEIGIQVLENVRGKDVFIVQPTCPSGNGVNDNLMELILLISTMRRASVHSITAVLPYYGYARQDRKMRSRVPISAADVARLLESVGVDRVVAVDLHCGQIQGFFGPRTPCDNLDGSMVALPYFQQLDLEPNNTVVVSPDAGGVYRAKQFREGLKGMGLQTGLAMIIKQRVEAGKVAAMDLVGNVEGCDCIIVDDMIDTAGTLCKAGKELKRRGANRIFAFATHGLFSGPAIERINDSVFEKVVVTDTIPMNGKQSNKIESLSIAKLLAKAIHSVHFRTSISELFEIKEGVPFFHKSITGDD